MDKDFIAGRLKDKFGISTLNEMQNAVLEKWQNNKKKIVVYSPTGSGKTLAFAVPLLLDVNENSRVTQVVIIEPSRELVLQATDVLKKLAPSIKTTPCYGGHNSQDERQSLSQVTTIVVATPGRLLDHIERGNINVKEVTTLVLDEFDKSLELGFVDVMQHILERLPSTTHTIMTSATKIKDVPGFFDFSQFETINFLKQDAYPPQTRITTWQVPCYNGNRMQCLLKLLTSLPDEKTIVFANERDTAHHIFHQLIKENITAGLYIGTLEQSEREKVLSMFRNGSLLVLVSTDLGGRGIDICDIKHIIHYNQPITSEVLTHRNGRTARVDANGDVYIIIDEKEASAPFIDIDYQYHFGGTDSPQEKTPSRATIHITAGKKEKISRGDIVGYLLHNCSMLEASEIAGIDIYDHYTLVGVPREKAERVVKSISPFKLKKQKVKSLVVQFMPKFVK